MLVLNLLFLGALEVQTTQSQPIKGTPVLVPEPKMVMSNKVSIFMENLIQLSSSLCQRKSFYFGVQFLSIMGQFIKLNV